MPDDLLVPDADQVEDVAVAQHLSRHLT